MKVDLLSLLGLVSGTKTSRSKVSLIGKKTAFSSMMLAVCCFDAKATYIHITHMNEGERIEKSDNLLV